METNRTEDGFTRSLTLGLDFIGTFVVNRIQLLMRLVELVLQNLNLRAQRLRARPLKTAAHVTDRQKRSLQRLRRVRQCGLVRACRAPRLHAAARARSRRAGSTVQQPPSSSGNAQVG